MVQTDSLNIHKLEELLCKTEEISNHTDIWGGLVASSITIISIVASLVTIVGIYMIFREIHNRKYTRTRQKLFILDIIRHLFVNLSILEAVRIKTNGEWQKYHPAEGVLSRFAVLDSDLSLANIQVKDSSFVKMHSICVFLRNYNSCVSIMEKHFSEQVISVDEKNLEMNDLIKRTKRLVKELIELGVATKLLPGSRVDISKIRSGDKTDICDLQYLVNAKKEVTDYIKRYYKNDNDGIIVDSPLPDRLSEAVIFDDAVFGLKEEFDKRVFARTKDIRIVSF